MIRLVFYVGSFQGVYHLSKPNGNFRFFLDPSQKKYNVDGERNPVFFTSKDGESIITIYDSLLYISGG